MINIPWYFRMSLESVLIITPFYLATRYNGLVYELFREKRRLSRRRNVESVDLIQSPIMDIK